jgi:flagellar FliL protein
MAEETTNPNADTIQEAPEKKKRKKLVFMIALLVVLLGGGGAGFYYWRARTSTQAQAKALADRKSQTGEEQGKAHNAEGAESGVTQVIELQPFIVNLADKNESRYLRMTISLGVAAAGGEHKVDPLFTTRIRNAILATISTQTSEQVLTVEGKAALRKEMLNAARAAASEPEVLTIYITDFIIQM